MRTCAPWWGRGGLHLRSGILLLIPPFVLALHILVVGPRLPRAARAGVQEQEDAVAFYVISIEPVGTTHQRGFPTRAPGLEEVVEVEDWVRREEARAYEDENEMHSRQVGPRPLEVQPWVADKPSFTAELNRIVTYITRPQLNCSRVFSPGPGLLPAVDRFMNEGDADFLKTVSGLGCEVHSFDPSNSNASGGYLGNSLASHHGDSGVVNQHKMWLEWRAPRKRQQRTRGSLGSVSQTLADIMAALGHHTIHFMYADLLSAEWRVFQNWIESGILQHVHHLVATVHLQWAGFEVGGSNEEVLRYWFSVLQGLQASGLQLVHTSAGGGHSVLKQTVAM